MAPESAETVLVIHTALVRRANREALWGMLLTEVDLRAMAEEIAESLSDFDGTASARTLTEKDLRDCFERENGYPLPAQSDGTSDA